MKVKLFALALLVAELCGAEDLVARFAKVLPEAEITRAEVVAATGLAEVEYTLRPSADSLIRCTLALPAPAKWSGRFRGFGNGGAAGHTWIMRDPALQNNDAAAHTDMGSSRGVGSPDTVLDFGHRATHLMTTSAKKLTEAYYGRKITRSYFQGESTGGGQSFHEAIRYPDDYDGILAGVPANTRLPLHMYFAWTTRELHDAQGRAVFTPHELAAVRDAGLAYFADKDPAFARGRFLVDSRWTPEAEQGVLAAAVKACPSLDTPDKLARLRRILRGPEMNGRHIHSGVPLGAPIPDGAGNQWMLEWWLKAKGLDKPARAATDAELLAWEQDFHSAFDAYTEDLDRFFARGGKLLVYGGLEDAVVPYPSMIDWYDRAARRYGAKLADSCRFYLVPGRRHGPGQYVAGLHDPYELLRLWVEDGRRPETVPLDVRGGQAPLSIAPYPDYFSAIRSTGAVNK